MQALRVLAFVLVLFNLRAVCADNSIVSTQYGTVRGDVQPQYRAFRGVPFAAPPGSCSICSYHFLTKTYAK